MYLRGPGGVLVFSRFIFYFLIEKLLVRVPQAPASERRLCHSDGTCGATR